MVSTPWSELLYQDGGAGDGAVKRMARNALIKVIGLGLQEYFSRVLHYRAAKTQALKLKDAIKANEEIADLGGASEEDKRTMREYNRARFKEVTQKMILDCRYLSLEHFPKEFKH